MALALSSLTNGLLQWVLNPLLWIFILAGIVVVIYVMLVIRRKRRINIPCVEVVDLGNGKMGFNNLKCGWIGKKLWLRGLIWSGDEILRTNYNDIIEQFSTEDYQEVNGKRGVICYRHPLNQKILLPISQLNVKNKEVLANIAPADYTDTAVDIIKANQRETVDRVEKLVQYAVMAMLGIVFLIAIIIIIQFIKSSQADAKDLFLQSGKICMENAKTICESVINSRPSSSGAP